MFVITYLYNKLFVNKNKIELDTEDIKKKQIVKNEICNNICDMKALRNDDIAHIKTMSHGSLVDLIGLLSNVNNAIIYLLDDYMISNDGQEDHRIDTEKS